MVLKDVSWSRRSGVGLALAVALGAGFGGGARAQSPASPSAKAESGRAQTMQEVAAEAFASHCAQCHALVGIEGWRRLTPGEFYRVLRRGQMQEPATGLDDGVLHALAQTYGNPTADRERPANGCATPCRAAEPARGLEGSWPGFSAEPTNTRLVPQPLGKADIQGARLKWSFAFPDTGFAHGADNPVAIANGRVYVGNLNHHLYALDARTGCAVWTFEADTGIRSGATVEAGTVVVGDMAGTVYGLDEATGALRWRRLADPQSFGRITGTPLASGGRVFVPVSYLQEILGVAADRSCCTANGTLVALDLPTGKPLWQTYMIDRPLEYQGRTAAGARRFGPSGAPIFAPPTLDAKRRLLYVSTGNQTTGPAVPEADAVVALDAGTGAKRWVRSLAPADAGGTDIYNFACEPWVDPSGAGCPPGNRGGSADHNDRDISAPTMLVRREDGRDVLIAGTKDGMLYALDPDADGKILWQLRLSKGGELGGIQYGMATDGRLVYAPTADIQVSANTGEGALHAVDLMTGRRVWRTALPGDVCRDKKDVFCVSGIVSPPVVAGEAVVVGGMDGVLRAYDRRTGEVFWSYDAYRDHAAANGRQGRGGGFGMGGVTIVGNMMVVASGVNSDVVGPTAASGVLLAFELGAELGAAPQNPRR
jgi:polyvinyl alcohol dehydrogenase (cytochrome)